MTPGTSVIAHVLKMKGYFDQLEKLGAPVSHDLATDMILASLTSDYDQFVMNFNMHNMEKSINELHGMLKQAEQNIRKSSPNVLMVQKGQFKKNKGKGKGKDMAKKGKGKQKPKPKVKPPKEGTCFHCNEPGHWKRNCKLYLEEKKKQKASETATSGSFVIEINMSTPTSWVLDTGYGVHICVNVQGLKRSRSLAKEEVDHL
ncbi:hypothetical protein M9H77_36191 [Catharanthus roseus]|uniref:Uncharacterized protein n=1 Tax=Catharanthus roseus TaxID=4058 RepID=A0ACB9ZTP3_CATRO|nr:hypothetical protein M9H77_36191 [Catharanthus roseus]